MSTSSAVPASRRPRAIVRQQWTEVNPPPLGRWTPTLTVTVVLPAKDCQSELDLTLAALAAQTYPTELLRVIVVDDASETPLSLGRLRPADTRLFRLPPAEGHGSGRARHAGALAAADRAGSDTAPDDDIILFLDADMVATRTHVEAHARWHHVTADAVVLGRKEFVEFDALTARDVHHATRNDTFDALLSGRPRQKHVWQEQFIAGSERLTTPSEDTFIAVVGASVSTTRRLYAESGGFSSMGLRGIVDTEFGYRIFTAGGVIIPDLESQSFHQGARNFSTRGDEIKRERIGLAANHLPIPLFRRAERGRTWVVPTVHVLLAVHPETDPALVLLTADNILASSFSDLTVTVTSPGCGPLPRWIRDYFQSDQRVRFTTEAVASGFPSPCTLVVPVGTSLPTDAVQRLREALAEHQVGVVRATVPGLDGPSEPSVELWATRALHRSRRHQEIDGLESTVRELFGEHWLSGQSLGLAPVVVKVTRQGMLIDGHPLEAHRP